MPEVMKIPTPMLHPQMRDTTSALVDMADKALSMSEAISEKLFGEGCSENCDERGVPQNVQSGVDVTRGILSKLFDKLAEINSRL